jgi:hypothetical protein
MPEPPDELHDRGRFHMIMTAVKHRRAVQATGEGIKASSMALPSLAALCWRTATPS